MKCPYCNKEIDDYSLTCPECGANLAIEDTPVTKVDVEVVDEPIYDNNVVAKNKDATIGLVFSIIGLFINLACLLSIIGLLFSIKGYRKSKELNGLGKGKSIAGIVCAIIQIVYFILTVFVYIAQ